MIVPSVSITTPDHYVEQLRQFATVAADYFDNLAEHQGRRQTLEVGISGGETLFELVMALTDRQRNVNIHALAVVGHGDLPIAASHVDPLSNATIMWTKSGRWPNRCHYATMTPYSTQDHGDKARKDLYRQLTQLEENPAVRSVIELMQNLDVAFSGLGILDPLTSDPLERNRLTMMGLLEPFVSTKALAIEGAIGDLSYCLFDANGDGRKEWQFLLTPGHYSEYSGVEFYKNMVKSGKLVVVIAGAYKTSVLKAALKGKLFNVWITDRLTAQQILEGD